MRGVITGLGLLALTACGGGGTTGTNYSEPPPVAEIVATPSPVASPSAEPTPEAEPAEDNMAEANAT